MNMKQCLPTIFLYVVMKQWQFKIDKNQKSTHYYMAYINLTEMQM